MDSDVRAADRVLKHLLCLGCGVDMVTDRCHRFCGKCRRRNAAQSLRSGMAEGHRVLIGGDSGSTRDGGSQFKANLHNHINHDANTVELFASGARKS